MISVYKWYKDNKNSGGKVVFSGGFQNPPLCTNGSAGYLMQLSVKVDKGGAHSFCKKYNSTPSEHV